MEMHPSKRLPDVLRRYSSARLKEAIDSVSAMPGTQHHDRTTFERWLQGKSTPSDGEFIGRLADELGDPEIVEAWNDDKGGTNREVTDLLTRFRSLPDSLKGEVMSVLAAESFRVDSATRASFTMRIELHGGLTEDCHRLDVNLEWEGYLPPNASVVIAPDEKNLVEAYRRDQCIFRELVPVGSDALTAAMAVLQDTPPALLYKLANSNTVEEPSIQESHEGGQIYQFDNEEVSTAEIRLTASLPYPADLPMYPVMLGSYAVAGRAKIIMVTDPTCAGQPHALRFLGQTPSWEYRSGFAESQLTVEIGGNGSHIEQNSGVVFFWHAAPIGSGG
jgi:hypothetical protein